MPSALTMPTASTFFDHVVVVLGHLTGFRPHTFIDHRKVAKLVLERAQIDVDNLPKDWPLTGKPSLSRNIGFAHRNRRAAHCRHPLTELGDRGLWGLTAAGVERAKSLLPREMPAAADFTDPLLSVLGRLTDYGKRFVSYDEVKSEVLRTTGYDVTNLPKGWSLTGRSGLGRRVTNIFARLKNAASPLTRILREKIWGLTEKGALAAREINHETLPMPKAAALRDALLCVLGSVTEFSHREGVRAADVRQAVCGRLEIDLSDLPSHWSEESLFRRVTNAFYSMGRTFTKSLKRGWWALTRRGVKKARRLSQNATARWIDDQGAKLITYLIEKTGKKLPVSKTLGTVEDHVHTYLTKAIKNDALAKKLREGNGHLPKSKIVSYCVRSAYTDIRGEGTDAHCRQLRGSLTEQNRKEIAETGVDNRRTPWTDPRIVLSTDDHGGVIQDIKDEFGEMSWIDDRLDFQRASDALRTYADECSGDFGEVSRLLFDDYSTTEIAHELAMGRRAAAAMVREVQHFARSRVAA